jgi:hypothetical protein
MSNINAVEVARVVLDILLGNLHPGAHTTLVEQRVHAPLRADYAAGTPTGLSNLLHQYGDLYRSPELEA